jgi:hypothetical protein
MRRAANAKHQLQEEQCQLAQLPHIKGTVDDGPINGLIDATNARNSPLLSAHAATAIGRFLLENHETTVGPEWLSKVMPLVGDAKINDELVDKMHARLKEASELQHSGFSPVLLVAVLLAVLVGIIWWFFA